MTLAFIDSTTAVASVPAVPLRREGRGGNSSHRCDQLQTPPQSVLDSGPCELLASDPAEVSAGPVGPGLEAVAA